MSNIFVHFRKFHLRYHKCISDADTKYAV